MKSFAIQGCLHHGEKMFRICFLVAIFAVLPSFSPGATEFIMSDDSPLQMPPAGAHQLRILSPSIL